ncbi:MAG: hypothetical protein Q8S84_06645 [bacterium]|nr:hypothetical protein [bacterium]MDP3381140.1 hypothetical protein [bacterium]
MVYFSNPSPRTSVLPLEKEEISPFLSEGVSFRAKRESPQGEGLEPK